MGLMEVNEKLEIIGDLTTLALRYQDPSFSAKILALIRWMFPANVTADVIKIGVTSGKLAAVKQFKDNTGLGIVEAKATLEDFFCLAGLEFKRLPDIQA